MKHLRTYTDENNVSHFASHDLELERVEPEGPVQLYFSGKQLQCQNLYYVDLPPGYQGYWHPSPMRQLYIYLSGRIQIKLDSEEIEAFSKGDTLLMEHLVGKGHLASNVGEESVLGILVRLDQS